MSRKNLSERTVQELLERAAEFDMPWRPSPRAFASLAACRAANGRPDEGPSAAALVEIQVHHHPADSPGEAVRPMRLHLEMRSPNSDLYDIPLATRPAPTIIGPLCPLILARPKPKPVMK